MSAIRPHCTQSHLPGSGFRRRKAIQNTDIDFIHLCIVLVKQTLTSLQPQWPVRTTFAGAGSYFREQILK